jgi:hypothetical protein
MIINERSIDDNSTYEYNIDLDIDQHEIKPTKISMRDRNKIKKTNRDYHEIKISSSEYVEPEFFNDYIAELKEPLKKVVKLELSSYKLPQSKYQFTYVGNEEKRTISLVPEKDINELIRELQNAFNDGEDKLRIKLLKNNKIEISAKHSFDILVNDQALCEVLGFTKLSYFGKKKYVSDKEYNISLMNKLYMYLENIIDDQPFAILDINDDTIENQNNTNYKIPIDELNELHIKFKNKADSSDNYLHDFQDQDHELNFKVSTL